MDMAKKVRVLMKFRFRREFSSELDGNRNQTEVELGQNYPNIRKTTWGEIEWVEFGHLFKFTH